MTNLPSSQGLSLYQLVRDTLQPSQFLTVSPNTLNSLVGALIDVLIERKILATIWVKLPPKDGWLTEIKRYQSSVGVTEKIYLCHGLGEDLIQVKNGVSQLDKVKENCQLFPIKLANGSKLEREYFLLIISEQFSSLIMAQKADKSDKSVAKIRQHNQLMSVSFTCEQQVIQKVFEGIKEAISVDDSISREVLELWKTRFSQRLVTDEESILTQMLIKQIQRTEDMIHSPISNNLSLSDSVVSLKSVELTQILDISTPTPPQEDYLNNKDELLKRVVQELRTPLTNMKTALKLLDAAQLKSVQRQRYMQLLNTECDRQNSLMTGLLELVQLDSEPQPTVIPLVQLADIVPGVVSTYQPLAREKGLQLGYTIAAGLPSVRCVENWLRQIIINLLHNSLKFTSTGGQVRVKATLQRDYIQIAFEDTGVGIAANEIPRIFDSFYRGRTTISKNTGAGLGLTIVQQLLVRCGGSISVTSKLGEGSSFKVLLPYEV